MSRATIKTETGPDGTEYRKAVPYEEPNFPEREYIIEDRATKETVLLCPGQVTEIARDEHGKRIYGAGADEDGPRKRGKEKVTVARIDSCRGYRPLADPMHATRMTIEEAADFARRHKWTKETHRIFKA